MDDSNRKYKIMLSGGGTAGHIFPAISIANELKRRFPKSEFLFVGAADRMEMSKVPQSGYNIVGLPIMGVQRKLTLKNVIFPFKLIFSLYKSYKLVSKFKPDVVIGTGGFASGPLLYIASLKGVPTLIQEQNSYPGITNKLLAKRVNKICVAFDNLDRFFPKNKIVLTGNPTRKEITKATGEKKNASEYFGLEEGKKTILVLGGSLGAKAINIAISKIIDWVEENNYQLIWQTGELYYDIYSPLKEKIDYNGILIKSFLDRVDLAYELADVVVTRAGAGAVSELCIVGKPTIFIPSPNVAEDHQTHNAMAISGVGAAVLVEEKNMENELLPTLKKILTNDNLRLEMSDKINKLAKPNATKNIVNEVEILLKRNK